MALSKRTLLVASTRASHLPLVVKALNDSCQIYSYNFETSSLDDILVGIHQKLQGRKVAAIGMLLHSLEQEMFLCFSDNKVVSANSVISDNAVRSFFMHLVQSHLSNEVSEKRIDFFNSCIVPSAQEAIIKCLESYLKVSLGIWKDLVGGKDQIGNLYFDTSRVLLESVSSEVNDEKLEGYEKIRTVGKGAFGTAVLYKNLNRDVLVVIKQINMVELSAAERQMALNEVQVLSVLNHPNIVSYYRSFESEGVLMIEMEYADGGTLAQLISRQKRPMPEQEILVMFQQICAAIQHMHQHNILHRDLKTANVFLTKDNYIKVGDFGISKTITTRAQAQTVLGTPNYISPEMCEGRQYNKKSDIWALGCILYEMACLRRAFQGSNIPALVNNITRGNFQPIPENYSPNFRRLVNSLLQQNPALRPTASHLVTVEIPNTLDFLAKQPKNLQMDSQSSIGRNSHERSILYELRASGTEISLIPLPLPARILVKQLAVSNTHYVILTNELSVLTWGEGSRGQLGHGDTPPWRDTPMTVSALGDHKLREVGAGDGFSVFVSDSGMLMTCGDGTFGCLGHSDWQNQTKPKLIEKLLETDVMMISCGPRHVAALAADGEMYTWGQGDGGRLGLGHERDCYTPTLTILPERLILRSIYCGIDGTLVISSKGIPYACGRNTSNKLGLSNYRFFWSNKEVEKCLVLTQIKSVTSPAQEASMGSTHTCILSEDGYVFTMGSNNEGQLGHQNKSLSRVTQMDDIVVTKVLAGSSYSIAVSEENVMYMWGTRSRQIPQSVTSQTFSSSVISTQISEETLSTPKEILALYASPKQIAKENLLYIGGVFALPHHILLLVHTTVGLPQSRKPEQSQFGPTSSEIDADIDNDNDSVGPVPDWIKAEAAASEAAWDGYISKSDVMIDTKFVN